MRYRLIKIYIILRNAFKMNHWRGHGVHSPFIYRFIREVVLDKTKDNSVSFPCVDIDSHNLLKRDRLFTERLARYLGYGNCIIAGETGLKDRTLCVAPLDIGADKVESVLDEIAEKYDECCIAVLGVNKSYEKYKLCRRTVKKKSCTSVDLYRTYVFFFDSKLQRQYYKIRNRV